MIDFLPGNPAVAKLLLQLAADLADLHGLVPDFTPPVPPLWLVWTFQRDAHVARIFVNPFDGDEVFYRLLRFEATSGITQPLWPLAASGPFTLASDARGWFEVSPSALNRLYDFFKRPL